MKNLPGGVGMNCRKRFSSSLSFSYSRVCIYRSFSLQARVYAEWHREILRFSMYNLYLCITAKIFREKTFAFSFCLANFALAHHAGSPCGWWRWADIYIKGVTVRFGFDILRISQILTICQEQSNKGRLMGWLYTYILPPRWCTIATFVLLIVLPVAVAE